MIGLGIVSLFLVVNASLRASLDDTIDNRFSGDLVVDSGAGFTGGGLPGTVADEIGALPEVAAATGVRFGFAQIDGTAVPVAGLNPDTAFDLFDVRSSTATRPTWAPPRSGCTPRPRPSKGWAVGDEVPVVFGDTGVLPTTVALLFDSKDLTGAYVMSTTAFDLNLPSVGDTQIWVQAADGVPVGEARAAVDVGARPVPGGRGAGPRGVQGRHQGAVRHHPRAGERPARAHDPHRHDRHREHVGPVGRRAVAARSGSPGRWAPAAARCGRRSGGRRC